MSDVGGGMSKTKKDFVLSFKHLKRDRAKECVIGDAITEPVANEPAIMHFVALL